jgi:hypothetical protein
MIERDELEHRFTHHPPVGDQKDRYERIRAAGKEFAKVVLEATNDSREQSLAVTHIEDAVMWANAAVARRG